MHNSFGIQSLRSSECHKVLKVILELLLCISVCVDPAVLVNMHCGFKSSQIILMFGGRNSIKRSCAPQN